MNSGQFSRVVSRLPASGARLILHRKTSRVREQSRTGVLRDVSNVMGGEGASCRSSHRA